MCHDAVLMFPSMNLPGTMCTTLGVLLCIFYPCHTQKLWDVGRMLKTGTSYPGIENRSSQPQLLCFTFFSQKLYGNYYASCSTSYSLICDSCV
jgi:hypothetical protein